VSTRQVVRGVIADFPNWRLRSLDRCSSCNASKLERSYSTETSSLDGDAGNDTGNIERNGPRRCDERD